MSGLCEPEDVREVLQERDLSGPISADLVEPSITGVSRWFRRQTNGHWYDSNGDSSDLVPTTAAAASDVRLDVPSSPHPQDRQLRQTERGVRYPMTAHGRYAKVPLPHPYVDSVTTLEVRQYDGGVEDWVAAGDKTEGRGEDYYIQRPGQESYGRTCLFVDGRSLGLRTDYRGLLTLAYDYGLDAQDTAWDDVRRGIAALVAADVLDDDGLLTQLPDNARLVGVETEHDNLLSMAARLLEPYLDRSL